MATEIKGKFFVPFIFGIEQEIKNPNYRPQFSNHPFPHLSSSISNNNNNNNNNNNLIKVGKSSSFADFTLDSDFGPIEMGEEGMRVARSVAAGCLLNYFAGTKPSFIPIVSNIIVAYMNRYGLISPFEKETLMKAFDDDSEEDAIEKMILAIEKALLAIEKDTGGVTNFIAYNLDGKGKDRVYVMAIRVDVLVEELLPESLRFRDLNISPTQVLYDEEYERQKLERLGQLDSNQNWDWNGVKWKLATTSTPTQTRNRTRTQRRRAKGQQGH